MWPRTGCAPSVEKKPRGDHVAAEPFCFGRPGEVVILVSVNRHGREGPPVTLPIEEVEIDDGAAVDSGRACIKGHKLFGMRIWQGFSNTPFKTEKSVVSAPIPSARVRMAMAVKPGDFRKSRTA